MPSRAFRAILLVPMYFKQFYLGCLAQASYLIGSEGEAVVVDPRRDVDEYLAEAQANGLRIRYVIETHLHADFVSGHRELAERTGAEVVFGARGEVKLPHRAVRDGDELRVGRVTLRFLETPGHTPESLSVLVSDADAPNESPLVLTGDTLFIGDVGRPDLAGSAGFTAEQMASMLYDSLHGKLLKLSDATAVYPAHGAGSLCGRNISKETSSTIGHERRTNYALRPMSKPEFVKLATADLPEVPQYFAKDVAINREGAPPLAGRALPKALTPAQVAERASAGAQVVDVRPAAAFGAGHVPGSWSIGLSGQFASWGGALLDAKREIVIVAEDEGGAAEAALRLARVGLENVTGYLAGGIEAWFDAGRALATLPQWPVDELGAQLATGGSRPRVLDVRRPGEYAGGHVPGAVNIPLDRLAQDAAGLDRSRPIAIICASGYRSSVAGSLLQRQGFEGELYNVVGGTSAWIAAGLPTEGS
jgi:glyoxylase-like metal-dependent hydrolase (beta-lactamase superfamily II)/3-mercaptopyruvate sulfurtransferase SseA